MENNKLFGFIKKQKNISAIIVLTLIFGLLAPLNIFQRIDYRFYDMELKLLTPPEESEDIALVEVDDNSLSYIGSWPWQRDILSEVLFRLKEFGAKTAVFDIEYLTASSLAVDENLTSTVKKEFDKIEQGIVFSVSDFSNQIGTNVIKKEDAEEAGDELIGSLLNDYIYESSKVIQQGMNLNYDDEFAKNIQFFGNAFLTVNLRNIGITTPKDELDYAKNRFLFTNIIDPDGLIKKYNDFLRVEDSVDYDFVPAIHSIVNHAAGIGFTNVVVDRDGVRRRIELINDCGDGQYALQLSFSPFIKNLGVKKIERKKSSLVLYDALLPGKDKTENITIPLDSNGCMILNWSHNNYIDSFSHIPVYYIYDFSNAEKRLVDDMQILSDKDDVFYDDERDRFLDLCQMYAETQEIRSSLMLKCSGFEEDGTPISKGRRGGGLTDDDYEEYFGARNLFFDTAYTFAVDMKERACYDDEDVKNFCKHIVNYCSSYDALKTKLDGKFCLIGNSATASTDLGATPFEKRYANLGTHANVVNTILSGKFIAEKSVYYGIILAFISSVLITLLIRKKSNGRKLFYSLLYIVITIGVIVGLMVMYRIYIPLVLPSVLIILIYITEFTLNFMAVEGDKKFLQTTFGSYVAPAVVDQIIKNPDVAKLGGRSEELTALFSDVKTFSGFTEIINNEEMKRVIEENNKLPESERKDQREVEMLGAAKGAERLVQILNDYLGVLSDAIMDNKGTIDKYVGDEIVSFFGAPIPNKNNAFDACVAAVRMIEAERKFNEENADRLPVNPKPAKPSSSIHV